jgi:hypothetical protein
MQSLLLFFLFSFISLTSIRAQENETEFLLEFLQGRYITVGRFPDSSQPYTGVVLISKEADHLKITRIIKGMEINGIGRIESITPDKVKVLQIEFEQDDCLYEGTYLIGSDLDNYGRLSGYIYLKEGDTKQVGLEALFYDQDQLKQ